MEQHRQFAALPFIKDERGISVLLLTSRETGRWVIPKGWPMRGMSGHQVAVQEAKEEAGVSGVVSSQVLGNYSYRKRLHTFSSVDCLVEVYALEVKKQKLKWRERSQRQLVWLPQEEAAARVEEPELAHIIRNFSVIG